MPLCCTDALTITKSKTVTMTGQIIKVAIVEVVVLKPIRSPVIGPQDMPQQKYDCYNQPGYDHLCVVLEDYDYHDHFYTTWSSHLWDEVPNVTLPNDKCSNLEGFTLKCVSSMLERPRWLAPR